MEIIETIRDLNEVSIIVVNVFLLIVGYFFIYPKYVKDNLEKLTSWDLVMSSTSLLISGLLFWNSGKEFYLLSFSLNWFLYTLLIYAVLELPLFFRYMKKWNMSLFKDIKEK